MNMSPNATKLKIERLYKSQMKKTIYNNAFTQFTDKEFDEKYALISHAIQLGDTVNAKKYRDI